MIKFGNRTTNRDVTSDFGTFTTTTSTRHLGIIIDSALSFKEHHENLIKKSKIKIGFILRRAMDASLRLGLYKALVLPIFEFGSAIWGPKTHIMSNRIEQLQRYFLRRTFSDLPNYGTRLKHSNLQPIWLRFNISSLCTLHYLFHSMELEALPNRTNPHISRNGVTIFQIRLTYPLNKILLFTSVPLYNNLPRELRDLTNGKTFRDSITVHYTNIILSILNSTDDHSRNLFLSRAIN